MKPWILFAILSMIFAGFTSVIAKMGLTGISSELGLTVRTVFVFSFVLVFAAFFVSPGEVRSMSSVNYLWLGISAVTTTLSWIFYYKALKDGEVSTIALIDKGSIIIAVLCGIFVLKEQVTLKVALGGAMMIAGLLIIAKK
jgi:bacterial/archaeal transporter family protein